jgi:hypothetical protein
MDSKIKCIAGWAYTKRLTLLPLIMLLCMGWQYMSRQYVRGAAQGMTSGLKNDEAKVQAILDWFKKQSPSLRVADTPMAWSQRDVETILNSRNLLKGCGTAAFAFVNVAKESGLLSRRLILLRPNGTAKHVVAEVYLDGRWAVVDPSFTTLYRNPAGGFYTHEDLLNSEIYAEAARELPRGVARSLTYERATHVRFEGIPIAGKWFRKLLDRVAPGWDTEWNWFYAIFDTNASVALWASGVLFFISLPPWHRLARFKSCASGKRSGLLKLS